MNIKLLSKIGIIFASIFVGLFLLFLILPFFVNFAIDKCTPKIVAEINKATGLSAGLEEVKVVTTPKLTAGLKIKKFELYTPEKEPIFESTNFQVKMSLLPLLAKKIRVDVIKCGNADITLKFNKDGDLDFLKYLPQSEEVENNESNTEDKSAILPFGFKLSNHLPDIHIAGYKLTVTDGSEKYVIEGGKSDLTDFIINKHFKFSTVGKVVLKDREQFNYNIKLFNKIMPDIDLNELIFESEKKEKKKKKESEPVNILSVLKGIYEHKVTTNVVADLKTEPDKIYGSLKLDNVSIIGITPSNANLEFRGDKINADADIYTAKDEVTKVKGQIITGKKPYVDMNLKSDLAVENVLSIVKKIALIFDIKDLQTLTASGRINADFNIKSDLKKVQSSGYLKIPAAKLYYGLYKIGVDNINADINLDNNNINIKNAGFAVLGQPLRLYGTITEKAESDLHLTASKLKLKGLLIAVGQAALMKENPIYSGDISMDVVIKGALDKINPVIKLDISNVDLKNIPTDLRFKLPSTQVNIVSDGKTFSGNSMSKNIMIINPVVKVSVPNLKANIKEEEIEITKTPVKIEKINTTVSGKITNYLTEKIGLNFVSSGDIKSTLIGDINAKKQTLNLNYATTDTSEIVVPLFDKSKMFFTGKLNISGLMTNPIVSGNIFIPSLKIPEIPVTMKNLGLKLHGTILHGSGTLEEFTSGGIKAENCSSDFELKGNDFYLNNLKGNAFDGKINGNIVYNLSNAKTSLDFHGEGLNATKAVEGAAGIKKALTGTLGFNTKLTLTVLDYNDMVKSMKGNLDFSIKNGAFLSIGRFENFLNASNIITNGLLKTTVASISEATGLATTAEFEKIEGKMSLSNGWADLKSIKSAGKSLCYYVTGKFNLLNFTTKVTVLGRLDAPMVSKLGIFGQLSADKILGPTIGSIVKSFTTNPAGEKVEQIPALTNGSTNYKDFKVVFNGGIESTSSIKSFKWLSNPDLSGIEQKSIKESLKDIKSSASTDVQTTINTVNDVINNNKQLINDSKDLLKNAAEEYKNLFKSLKETPSVSTEAKTTETTESTEQ